MCASIKRLILIQASVCGCKFTDSTPVSSSATQFYSILVDIACCSVIDIAMCGESAIILDVLGFGKFVFCHRIWKSIELLLLLNIIIVNLLLSGLILMVMGACNGIYCDRKKIVMVTYRRRCSDILVDSLS